MFTIGYIDEDPLQVKKYKRKLEDSFNFVQYDIPKGISKEDLIEQIYHSDIDLLLVDYLMTDKGFLTFNGDEIARDYEKIKPRFPIIIFTNRSNDAFPKVDNPNIIYSKDLLLNSKDYFIEVLKKNITVYKDYINERKVIINELIEKQEKTKLTADEKHLLVQNEIELKNLDKKSVEVPYQLLKEGKIEHLAETVKKAEEFLESLLKQKKK
jgi:CheY-like chemotaxis protein